MKNEAKKSGKQYDRMKTLGLARATKEFDAEFVADDFSSLDRSSRARWAAVKRKRGRPVRGKGAKAVSVTIERTLLQKTDKLARKLKVSRAQLIERGLRGVLREAS